MEPIIFESPLWKVILLENQYYLGRNIVVYKGDAVHLSQLSLEAFVELKRIIDVLESSISKVFGATHFNWTCLMNDYYKPKNRDKKKELHLHCWPRYEKEVIFEGESFIDEVFGHHYDKTKEKIVTVELLNKIKTKIKIKSNIK
ncbi:MAG: hypothetical protein Fur003_6100 [Candidatus Dojkabacteria bacterium]